MSCRETALMDALGVEVTWYRPSAFTTNTDKTFAALSVSDSTVVMVRNTAVESLAMGYAINTETGTVKVPAATASTVQTGDRFTPADGIRRRLVGIGRPSALFGFTEWNYESEAA